MKEFSEGPVKDAILEGLSGGNDFDKAIAEAMKISSAIALVDPTGPKFSCEGHPNLDQLGEFQMKVNEWRHNNPHQKLHY